jgi:hypothetical protein
MGFGFALDGVDDVGGAERDVQVGDVVLVEEGGFVGRDADAKDADVVIFEDEMVVGFLGNGDGGGGLGGEWKCDQKKERAEKRLHRWPPSKRYAKEKKDGEINSLLQDRGGPG